jgi:RES domain-containing protein
VLDTRPRRLTQSRILDLGAIHILWPDDVPNQHWLSPGRPNSNQQRFGDDLTRRHRFVLIPSVVSRHSWNLIFDTGTAAGAHDEAVGDRFALDRRLQP